MIHFIVFIANLSRIYSYAIIKSFFIFFRQINFIYDVLRWFIVCSLVPFCLRISDEHSYRIIFDSLVDSVYWLQFTKIQQYNLSYFGMNNQFQWCANVKIINRWHEQRKKEWCWRVVSNFHVNFVFFWCSQPIQ